MFSLDGRTAGGGSARVSLATGKPATPPQCHSPRMCYQHPNGVMSLLKHLAISVRFTMKAALFISDFTGANHIWHPSDRMIGLNAHFGNSQQVKQQAGPNILTSQDTPQICATSTLRFVALDLFKAPCLGA